MDARGLTMTLTTGSKPRIDFPRRAGFTLIELVLVMAILIVVLSMSATSLSSFFKGRTLQSEGSRFLALTRHAQNRAVSEGLPMSLWIDEEKDKYGLEIAPGFEDRDEKAKEFALGQDLSIEVHWADPGAIRPTGTGSEIVLRFTPEGYLDETNPDLIEIKDKSGAAVRIAQNRNRLNYEITTNNVLVLRR